MKLITLAVERLLYDLVVVPFRRVVHAFKGRGRKEKKEDERGFVSMFSSNNTLREDKEKSPRCGSSEMRGEQ